MKKKITIIPSQGLLLLVMIDEVIWIDAISGHIQKPDKYERSPPEAIGELTRECRIISGQGPRGRQKSRRDIAMWGCFLLEALTNLGTVHGS